jgi:SOS-response transcriptional repressor LexA
MNKVGKYLKKKREEADLSLREASKLANVSHTHIMDLEDGKKSPAFDKVMQILHAYHADVQDFLRETGYLPKNVEPASIGKQRKIPVVSWVLAGKWGAADETFQEEDTEEWIESDIKGAHNFALRVKGDSMEPEFNEGDIIIVSPHDKAMSGDYVVAKNDEEEATFKQYKRFDNTRILHPLNPKYPDIVLNKDLEYRIVGVVMEKKKRYK